MAKLSRLIVACKSYLGKKEEEEKKPSSKDKRKFSPYPLRSSRSFSRQRRKKKYNSAYLSTVPSRSL